MATLTLGKVIFNSETEEMAKARHEHNRQVLGGELCDQWAHRYDPHYVKFEKLANNFREYDFRMEKIRLETERQDEINALTKQLSRAEMNNASLQSEIMDANRELDRAKSDLGRAQSELSRAKSGSGLSGATAGAVAGAAVAGTSTSLIGAIFDSLYTPATPKSQKRWAKVEAEGGMTVGGGRLRGYLEGSSKWYGFQSRGEPLHSFTLMNNNKYAIAIRYDKSFDDPNNTQPTVIIEVHRACKEGQADYKTVKLSSFYRERGSTKRDGLLGVSHQSGDWYLFSYINSRGFTCSESFQIPSYLDR